MTVITSVRKTQVLMKEKISDINQKKIQKYFIKCI